MPPGIVELRTVPFEKLLAYDCQLFPSQRSLFLQYWIEQPGSAALGVLKDGYLTGYGVIRPAYTGLRIGRYLPMMRKLLKPYFSPCLHKILMFQSLLMCQMSTYKRLL